MKETTGIVTFKGGLLTLLGTQVSVGQKAPDAALTENDLSETKISAYAGKVVIICSVPSLDTPVCDIETRRFNGEAARLGSGVRILTISMDLPFAQKRWCGAAGVQNLKTLSDYKDAQFAKAYGLLIKELHLLARAVIVLDKEQKIRYMQIVPEISEEPDYVAVLKAAGAIL